ncbi:hypothetical protein CYY_005736 [Polysphondylium violaceum]|uniref:FNIP repeat-containing protein n=1 Tax=Polysphondylium violaceum TaxID=133409 RepID=A0A8J4UZF5_9MYCE|nr:hypothetical protein CYY_005736 [Polysphondylium violaceum]
MNNNDQLFFSIFKNKYLMQKIYCFYYDYTVLRNITDLDKKHNHISSLHHQIPIVYHLQTLDHYVIYNSHKHKHLITHFILSTRFYLNHLNVLQQQNNTTTTPIIFGISINDRNDPILFAHQLPPSIKYYRFKLTETVTKNHIPPSVTSIYLESLPIDVGVIPNNVKTLALYISNPSDDSYQINPKWFPQSLTSLTYVDVFAESGVDMSELPKSLTYLNIKNSLTGIGHDSIKYLLNRSYESFTVPSGVTHFHLCGGWDSFEDVVLPPSVTHFEIVKETIDQFIPKIPNFLPLTLKSLSLETCSNSSINIDNCPPNLLYYSNYNERCEKVVPYIPPLAKKVILSTDENTPNLPSIPKSVTDLSIRCSVYDYPFKGTIPNHYFTNNLVKLVFHYFGQLEPGVIPSNITDLELGTHNPIIQGVIPCSVTKLSLLCDHVVQPIIIPQSVTTLSFWDEKQVYSNTLIPNSVKTLKFSFIDFTTLKINYLPKSISTLCIDDTDSYQGSEFEERFQIQFPNYNIDLFPSNIKLVKFTQKGDTIKRCYHFINQKVYMEIDFEKDRFMYNFKKINTII